MSLYDRIERAVVAALAGAALAVGVAQMLLRYYWPQHAPDWTEEVQVYLLVWAMLLAGSRLAELDRHIKADLVTHFLRPSARRWLEVVNAGLAAVVCTAACRVAAADFGAEVVRQGIEWNDRSLSTLRFPLWIYFLSLPAAATLMAIRFVRRAVRLVRQGVPEGSAHH